MTVGSTMRDYGRTARFKAGSMSHQMKDRALEKRLDRASSEADRLRFENEMLRDEVDEARTEHRRILDMLDERLPEHAENGENGEHHSHKGRWFLFLLAVGGGIYAFVRSRQQQPEPGSFGAEGSAGI
ncbi:MAG TPA: hypothetical protein VFT76_01440 [Actinomycetota bacterium]|jgi:hypothetical protein|nr:hypothetical protein [Actinomycetota bacterium]